MRFSYWDIPDDVAQYRHLAVALEEAGFNAFNLSDSVIYPRDSQTLYPYQASGAREFIASKVVIDPFVLATHMAAFTTRLKFIAAVIKLPIRDPVLVAKMVASADAMTGGRFVFGVGVSPWPEDFTACGQQWRTRGKRTDQMIEIIEGLLRGGYFEYHSELFDLAPMKTNPVPARRVPLLVGGHSDAALKRAAKYGDGWIYASGADELAGLLEKLRGFRAELGVANRPFEIHAGGEDAGTLDGIRRLEDIGVTDVIVRLQDVHERDAPDAPLARKIAAINDYAERVIDRL